MTIISDIFEMNKAFGNDFGDFKNLNRIGLKNQMDNLYDELDELTEAIQEDHIAGIADALGDIMVFLVGGFYMAGFTEEMIEKIMKEIYVSNCTKFAEYDEDLEDTINKYKLLGIKVIESGKGKFRYVKTPPDIVQTDVNGKIYRANKFLKCVGFKEPRLQKIIFG